MIKQFKNIIDEEFNIQINSLTPIKRIIIESNNPTSLTINNTSTITFQGRFDFDVSDRSEFMSLSVSGLSIINLITVYA